MRMSYEEIRQYVERNNEPNLTSEELDHVATCMENLMKWYYDGYPLGSFLQAIVKNDLLEASIRADDTNIKALRIYAWFMTWNMPNDWRVKGLKKD